jgi:peptide/nickel transport system substrate-binding protein
LKRPVTAAIGDAHSMMFNYKDEWFSRPKVRKAIAYLLNRDELRKSHELGYVTIEHPNGLTPVNESTFLPESLIEGMEEYGYQSSKTDQAASLLKEVGFSKEDGSWFTPDGDEWELDLATYTWAGNVAATQTAAGQIEQFGITANVNSADPGTLDGQIIPNGEFHLTQFFLGGQIHAAQALSARVNNLWRGQYDFIPETFTVPPVGEPDGDPVKMNILDAFKQYSQNSGDAAQEGLEKFTWIYNHGMVNLDTYEKGGDSTYDAEEWDLPATDSNDWRPPAPHGYLFESGKLRANDVDTHTTFD